MKSKVTFSIDSDVLENAKKTIPNLSGFIEECLRNYLGMRKHLIPTSKMHELVTNISKNQLELHLINEKNKLAEKNDEAKKEEINYAWRQLFTEYRDTKTINQEKLQHASEVLEVPADELVDIIEVLFAFQNEHNVDVTDWFSVYAAYGSDDK